MSTYLYRLGRWASRRRWIVLIFWLSLLVAVVVTSQAVKKDTNDAFNVPGTESQRALDLLDEKFPGSGGATARLVFAAPKGHTLDEPRYEKVVDPTVERARAVPQAVTTGEQFVEGFTLSRDRTIGFADLHFAVPVEDVRDSTKEALERVAGPAREAGLQVEFSGGVVSTSEGDQSSAEAIGVVASFVVLFISFGTLLLAGLPLVTAILGVAIGLSAISALTAVTEINSVAPTLATMLGLAVGIDYALFIVSRHRQQLADGLDPAESVARATATAGSAVVFAGVTVLIALVGLVVVGIPFLSVMGLAAAGTVAIAVLIAVTLLPALLGFAGQRAGRGRRQKEGPTAGRRWAQLVTRRPWIAIDRGNPEVRVAELPLDHVERHAFSSHLDSVRVPKLIRREATTHAGSDRELAKGFANSRGRPWATLRWTVDDASNAPTRRETRRRSHGSICSHAHRSMPTSRRLPPLPLRTRIAPRPRSRSLSARAKASLRLRDRSADAAGSAADQRRLPIKVGHVFSFVAVPRTMGRAAADGCQPSPLLCRGGSHSVSQAPPR